MARLQDFQQVTPSSSDNLLVVQATGQGLANYGSTIGNKAPKSDLASISITGTTNNTGSTIKAGTFFYLNGTLVRAKQDIGATTFTLNTNYEVVTAGGLNSITRKIAFSGTTSANGNINLFPFFNRSTEVIVAMTARQISNPSNLFVCIPYQYSSDGYGTTTGAHLISESLTGSASLVTVEGYIWVLPFTT